MIYYVLFERKREFDTPKLTGLVVKTKDEAIQWARSDTDGCRLWAKIKIIDDWELKNMLNKELTWEIE